MSAFGPKRTSPVAPHMSAFGGKADISIAVNGGLLFFDRVADNIAPFGPRPIIDLYVLVAEDLL